MIPNRQIPTSFLLRRWPYVLLLAFLFIFPPSSAWSQSSTDEQLAAQYFREEEYEKAAMYYKKLLEEHGRKVYYSYYLKSLVALEKYDDARKVVKKRMRRTKEDMDLHIDLGNVYMAAGKERKARKEYEAVIENLSANQGEIKRVANKFVNQNKPEYALRVYEKGKKLLQGYYQFNFEIARVYGTMGEHKKMIGQYLDLLKVNEAYLQSVQNSLNQALDFSEDSDKTDLLKQELLKRIQKNSRNSAYSEMLIWLYVQHQDYHQAFIQARALDKRQQGNGNRILNLAQLCTRNGSYETAEKCYQYLIDKGPENPHYARSQMAILRVLNKKITSDASHTEEDLIKLEKNYHKTLEKLGRSSESASMMKDLAHLKGFHLDKIDQSVSLLEEILNLPGISERTAAETKLELGDALLLRGDIWDASLYYSQVEKAFKHDKLGHKARFKNAKISFYTGDFEWAQAQLDVLKASTSKLIANNAMDLSLIITDNLNMDTTTVAMEMYARSDLHLFQNHYDQAVATLDSIKTLFPDHALQDEILWQKFKIEKDQLNYQKAAEYLKQIMEDHADDILGDNAMYELARLNEEKFGNIDRAKDLYKDFLTEYPASIYTVEARKRFRALRGGPGDRPQ